MLIKLPSSHCNITTSWWGFDNEENYSKNNNWGDIPVSYKINSNGYRADEWSSIDWNNSIVVIGCSIVFGQGLPVDRTLTSLLSTSLKRPCINLGVCGSSNALMFHNSLSLIDNNIKPYAVIFLFSNASRFTYFKHNTVTHFGPWSFETERLKQLSLQENPNYSKEELNFYSTYILNNNSDIHGSMIAIGAEALWKSQGIKSLAYETTEEPIMEKRFKSLPKIVDRARDGLHPGIETNKLWAEVIKNDLTL